MGDGVRRPPLNQEDNERTGNPKNYINMKYLAIREHKFFLDTHIFFFQNACFNGYGRVVVLLHVHP